MTTKENKKYQVHVVVDEKLYRELWNITKERFLLPSKKLSTVIREALERYVKYWKRKRKRESRR